MKYILTIALMFVAIAQTQAQGGITIEVKGGLNFAKLVRYENNSKTNFLEIVKSKKNLTGFHLGAIVGIPITETYSFETGLMFSQKGTKVESVDEGSSNLDEDSGKFITNEYPFERKIVINYLDIPLHLKGTFPINEGMSVFGIVGPTISFAIGGKREIRDPDFEGEINNGESFPNIKEDLKFGSAEGTRTDEGEIIKSGDDFKSLDFGFTFGAGVQFDKLSIGLNCDLGLANIIPGEEEEENSNITYSSKNSVFSISIGYRLF